MKILITCLGLIFCISCATQKSILKEEQAIQNSLTAWHEAAASANYDEYFGLMTKDAVFIGTDATENWQLEEFKTFSKPYFDKGKAWSFTTLERNLYVTPYLKTAWFDELLNTQMGICRGFGVVKKVDGSWKIQHYVLSISVPNENVSGLTALKKDWDEKYSKKLEDKF